jgi:hypothetical protein
MVAAASIVCVASLFAWVTVDARVPDEKLRQLIADVRTQCAAASFDLPGDDAVGMAAQREFDRRLERMQDHFSRTYSASREVADVLSSAMTVATFAREHASAAITRTWDTCASDLAALADEYGASFPLRAGATVVRVTDRDLARVAVGLAKLAAESKAKLETTARKLPDVAPVAAAIVPELESLGSAAKDLKLRLTLGKPATTDARQIVVVGDRINVLLRNSTVPSAIDAHLRRADAIVDTIGNAFGLPRTTLLAAR